MLFLYLNVRYSYIITVSEYYIDTEGDVLMTTIRILDILDRLKHSFSIYDENQSNFKTLTLPSLKKAFETFEWSIHEDMKKPALADSWCWRLVRKQPIFMEIRLAPLYITHLNNYFKEDPNSIISNISKHPVDGNAISVVFDPVNFLIKHVQDDSDGQQYVRLFVEAAVHNSMSATHEMVLNGGDKYPHLRTEREFLIDLADTGRYLKARGLAEDVESYYKNRPCGFEIDNNSVKVPHRFDKNSLILTFPEPSNKEL